MQQDKIWDYYQTNSDMVDIAFAVDTRVRFLVRQIAAGSDVLNIGVGKGALEAAILNKGASAYCLDPSEKTIEMMRQKYTMAERAQVGYSQSIPFPDSSFDVVVMSEVLEHLSEDVLQASIAECRRVLRSGGRFIGTVPANENLQESQVVCPDCGKVFHRWGHVQTFTAHRLGSLLKEYFSESTVKQKYFGNWRSLNWKGKLSWLLIRCARTIGIKGKGDNLFFIAQKT